MYDRLRKLAFICLYPSIGFSPLSHAIECDKNILAKIGYSAKAGSGQPESWHNDGPEHAKTDYEREFSDILAMVGVTSSANYFENLLQDRHSKKQSNHVLDLFGSCFFIENQKQADSLTGLRFGPFAQDQLPSGYPKDKVPTEVLGDIFHVATWDNLDKSMAERSIPSLDLVTMRPEGGWQYLELRTANQNIHALRFIVNNVKRRLSPTGRFYFSIHLIPQLPGSLSEHPLLKTFAREIEETSPYKLILKSKLSTVNTTYFLDGALVPK